MEPSPPDLSQIADTELNIYVISCRKLLPSGDCTRSVRLAPAASASRPTSYAAASAGGPAVPASNQASMCTVLYTVRGRHSQTSIPQLWRHSLGTIPIPNPIANPIPNTRGRAMAAPSYGGPSPLYIPTCNQLFEQRLCRPDVGPSCRPTNGVRAQNECQYERNSNQIGINKITMLDSVWTRKSFVIPC